MQVFSRLARLSGLIALVISLVACSASSRIVRTYEGEPQDATRVATILKPSDIEIESVDGKETNNYLMDRAAMTYELLPGQHTVIFRYSALWSIPGKKEIGEKNAEEIQSDLQVVTFNAVAGRHYTFEVPTPQSRDDAVRIARNFSTRLVDENARLIARSAVYTEGASSTTGAVVAGAAAGAAVAASSSGSAVANSAPAVSAPATPAAATSTTVAPTATATPGSAVSNLEALKILWESTSSEEKKEFLRWAFK